MVRTGGLSGENREENAVDESGDADGVDDEGDE